MSIRSFILFIAIFCTTKATASVNDTITHWPLFFNGEKVLTQFYLNPDMPRFVVNRDTLHSKDIISVREGSCLSFPDRNTSLSIWDQDKKLVTAKGKGNHNLISLSLKKVLKYSKKEDVDLFMIQWMSENPETGKYSRINVAYLEFE